MSGPHVFFVRVCGVVWKSCQLGALFVFTNIACTYTTPQVRCQNTVQSTTARPSEMASIHFKITITLFSLTKLNRIRFQYYLIY